MEPSRSESEALGAILTEQGPDPLIYADTEGVIRLWNARAAEVFGHTADEVLGRSLDVIIPERLREGHWRGFDAAVKTGVAKYAGRTLITRATHKDGRTLYVDMSFGLIKDPGGKVIGVLAVARDATERHLEMKALRERLRELEKARPA